jgi:hypothetical protein
LDVSTRGRGRDTEPMSYYYYYSKEYGYHSLDFCKGRGGEDWSEYLYLMYFEQEDDYIIHKKKFKTVREVIDYLQKGPERMHKRNRAEIRNEPFNEE